MLILYNFIKMFNFKMINVLLQWKQKSIIVMLQGTLNLEHYTPPHENQNLALGAISILSPQLKYSTARVKCMNRNSTSS